MVGLAWMEKAVLAHRWCFEQVNIATGEYDIGLAELLIEPRLNSSILHIIIVDMSMIM